MSFPRWNAASGPVISGPGCIFSLFLAPVVVRLQYAAALWYSECSFVAARLRAHMHLKGRSLDRLLMLRPFTSLPLCPRENFNPPQMQTASPWKLLWKLPQQQNARRPQTFPFFWTFFCFDLRGFWRTPALSVLLGVCGESIYLWFCRSERWRGGKMMRGLRFINRKLPTVGGCSGWGAQRWLSSLAALFILLKSAAQKKTKRFFSIQVSQPAHEKNPQTQRISFVSWRSVGIWPPFCRDDNAAIREENWLNPPPPPPPYISGSQLPSPLEKELSQSCQSPKSDVLLTKLRRKHFFPQFQCSWVIYSYSFTVTSFPVHVFCIFTGHFNAQIFTLLVFGESETPTGHLGKRRLRINVSAWGFIPKIYSIYLNCKISKLCQMFASNPLITWGPGRFPVVPVPSASLWGQSPEFSLK